MSRGHSVSFRTAPIGPFFEYHNLAALLCDPERERLVPIVLAAHFTDCAFRHNHCRKTAIVIRVFAVI